MHDPPNTRLSVKNSGGGEPLAFEVGYHPRKKKIHVITVVFQDQAMYACTSFGGAKTCETGKKECFFGQSDKFWKGHDRKRMQKCIFKVYFHT